MRALIINTVNNNHIVAKFDDNASKDAIYKAFDNLIDNSKNNANGLELIIESSNTDLSHYFN